MHQETAGSASALRVGLQASSCRVCADVVLGGKRVSRSALRRSGVAIGHRDVLTDAQLDEGVELLLSLALRFVFQGSR